MLTDLSDHEPSKLPGMFALIIGINKYLDDRFEDLSVAVKDADAIDNFLTTSMGVPRENITNLRDEEATREGIINAFISLAEHERIPKDAPIIIYYAGHGAREEIPPGPEWKDWEANDFMIEMMCPTDIGIEDPNGSEIEGIPDRTVSVLINDLSTAKGDNITLILDCCCSAGINRDINSNNDGTIKHRRIPNPPKISADCDRKVWHHRSRGAGVAQGFSGKHQESHILLAACGKNESAGEIVGKHGAFTEALLAILEGGNIADLTYTSLMHKLKLPRMPPEFMQTPHCEGHHVHRRLFNKTARGADSSFILGRQKSGGKQTILQAGAAQGLILHSKFGIHKSDLVSETNPELGTLELIKMHPFSSVLAFPPDSEPFDIPVTFYARQTERGPQKDFWVYCVDKLWLESILPADFRERKGIAVVENAETADMCLEVKDGYVFFDRRDNLITPYVGSRFPYRIDKEEAEQIRRVLGCAIHFKHHLTRTGADFKNVWMELHNLKHSLSKEYELILTPEGVNLIEEEPATIFVDEESRLGLTIYNESDDSFYPYLYYFDPSDLVIMPWYLPPFGGGLGNLSQVDAPLPAKGKLTVGYGSGGASPWQFLLREGENIDVGFFKLFLTKKPVDFSIISQDSPFELEAGESTRGIPSETNYEAWGIKMVTVIQKRPEPNPNGT